MCTSRDGYRFYVISRFCCFLQFFKSFFFTIDCKNWYVCNRSSSSSRGGQNSTININFCRINCCNSCAATSTCTEYNNFYDSWFFYHSCCCNQCCGGGSVN